MSGKEKVIEISSYILMGIFLLGCFEFKLMSTVVSALSVYLLITHFYKMISPLMKSEIANKLTLLALSILTIIALGAIIFGIYSAFKVGNTNIKSVGEDAFNILQEVKKYLPESVVNYIPNDILMLKEKFTMTLKESAPHIFEITGSSLKAMAHVVIGLFIGALIAFSCLKPEIKEKSKDGDLTIALKQRIYIFTDIFRKVIMAQVKISTINTTLTAMFLLVILPVFQVHMPYAKTLVLLTFIVGLIPVIGNLISNSLIFLISLTVGFKVAIAAIVFLIIVHKMEYYINARIVGAKIKTSIWELLIAMLVMETLFGLFGVALAPVIYGYIKEELKYKSLI
jgi:predicted PurR-regulated permease PerM